MINLAVANLAVAMWQRRVTFPKWNFFEFVVRMVFGVGKGSGLRKRWRFVRSQADCTILVRSKDYFDRLFRTC